MDNVILLQPTGIAKGISSNGFQSYNIIGEDKDKNIFVIGFGCLLIYTTSVEKAFSRLAPIDLPVEMKETETVTIQIPKPKELTDADPSKEN